MSQRRCHGRGRGQSTADVIRHSRMTSAVCISGPQNLLVRSQKSAPLGTPYYGDPAFDGTQSLPIDAHREPSLCPESVQKTGMPLELARGSMPQRRVRAGGPIVLGFTAMTTLAASCRSTGMSGGRILRSGGRASGCQVIKVGRHTQCLRGPLEFREFGCRQDLVGERSFAHGLQESFVEAATVTLVIPASPARVPSSTASSRVI